LCGGGLNRIELAGAWPFDQACHPWYDRMTWLERECPPG
jgi:hypothetical protein